VKSIEVLHTSFAVYAAVTVIGLVVVIGLIVAMVGGWVASLLLGAWHGANNYGFIGSLIVSFIGAVLLLLIVRAISGGRSRSAV